MSAITITISDVRNVIDTLSTDVLIQGFIDIVEESVGDCYSKLSSPMQKILKSHLVAYFLETSTGQNEVSSVGAPNGGSISYTKNLKTGLAGSPFGRVVLNLDQSGCWLNLSSASFGILSIGGAG